MILEMFVFSTFNHLMRLVAREDFIIHMARLIIKHATQIEHENQYFILDTGYESLRSVVNSN
jgi:hypothetical protein